MNYCADCGGFDIEWMYVCHKHRIEFCRGCACPFCAEEDEDDDPEYLHHSVVQEINDQ